METRRWSTWSLLALVILVLSLAFLSACGSETSTPDGDDPDGDTTDGDEEDGDTGDGDGPDGDDEPSFLMERLEQGQTRAGLITRQEELVGGEHAKGQVGDYKLYNSRIAVVVEGARPSDGWGTLGGSIAEADLVRPEGEASRNAFGEYFFGFGLRLQDTATAEVINDGQDGKPAVVRFTGPDVDLPFVDAAFAALLKSTPLDTTITVDYILPPDSNLLEIRSSFTWNGEKTIDLSDIIQVFILAGKQKGYKRGAGFNASSHTGPADLYITAGRYVSYGFFGEDPGLRQFFNYEGINFYSTEKRQLRPGKTAVFTRFVAITDGGVDPVLREYRDWLGTVETGEVSGRVTFADGSTPAAGARVHVLGTDGDTETASHFNQALADAEGRFSLELEPGTYVLVPFEDGFPISSGVEVTITAGEAQTKNLRLSDAGNVSFSVVDSANTPLPSRVMFIGDEARDLAPASFGETRWHRNAQWVALTPDGLGNVTLPPGAYTATASRGFEYSIDEQTFTLAAGETEALAFSLTRVVDTTGFVSSDFHIHSTESPDSSVPFPDRVISVAAEGVEVPIATDHDFVSDWMPTALSIGLEDWVYPVIGTEVTTYTYGHFNVWPMEQNPLLPNMGGFVWYYKMAPELLAEIAGYHTQPIIHVCHPRAAAIGGYFSAAKYNPETGTGDVEDNWTDQFDTIEIINGGDITTAQEKTLPDWYSFLNRGRRVTGASGSDTHKLTHEVGNVVNYVGADSDDPSELDPFALRDRIRDMQVLVTTGPFITVDINGSGMGKVVSVADGPVPLHVTVQGPDWMDIRRIKVIGNGETVLERELEEDDADATNPALRLATTLNLEPTQDTWYVLFVEGDQGRSPVTGPRPFAFTNPIFVDRDGNGNFDPPVPAGE